jgi:ABC-type multidrug transport system fused ATPase/permease subunit
MVKNPDLLILDEATSSLIVITERMLQASMDKLMQGALQ